MKHATKFVIDTISKDGIVTRKKYKTKAGFLNRIKKLSLMAIGSPIIPDGLIVCKEFSCSIKGIHYTYIWE